MAEAKTVNLSSADRVLFPDDGITKGDLFEYYRAVSQWIVPHLKNRPFTMKRWREGIAGSAFFQKQAPKGIPSWIPTRQFRTHPREGDSRLVKPDRPDFVLFDLDPPEEPDGFAQAIEVAHLVRGVLDEVGLPGYVKTSGADGRSEERRVGKECR